MKVDLVFYYLWVILYDHVILSEMNLVNMMHMLIVLFYHVNYHAKLIISCVIWFDVCELLDWLELVVM